VETLAAVARNAVEETDLRCQASRGLGEVGGRAAVLALKSIGLDPEALLVVKACVVETLAQIKDPQCRAILELMARRDRERAIRDRSRQALSRIDREEALAPSSPEEGGSAPVAFIQEALKHASWMVRLMAARAARDVADPGVEQAVIEAMSDQSPAVRAAAAESLGRIGEGRAEEALRALGASDSAEGVRSASERALAEIRERSRWTAEGADILAALDQGLDGFDSSGVEEPSGVADGGAPLRIEEVPGAENLEAADGLLDDLLGRLPGDVAPGLDDRSLEPGGAQAEGAGCEEGGDLWTSGGVQPPETGLDFLDELRPR
jgi:hypothetical protein